MRVPSILVAGSILFTVACGGGQPEPEEPKTETTVTATKTDTPTEPPSTTAGPAEPKKEEEKKEEPPPPPPKKTAKEIALADGAVFGFALAESADAKRLADEGCEKKAKKDEKKLEACKKETEEAAANEAIRFEKDDKGDLWWVSFGKEKDKEVVYDKVKVKVASEEEGKLVLTPEGKNQGKKQQMKTLPKELVVEVPDENTVILSDPKKGKLVYKKK